MIRHVYMLQMTQYDLKPRQTHKHYVENWAKTNQTVLMYKNMGGNIYQMICNVFGVQESKQGKPLTVFIGPRCPWSDLWIRVSITNTPFANLTDVTLTDDDSSFRPLPFCL